MSNKIPQSFIDKFPLLFKKAEESLSEPQKETEKVLIPEDGEVELQNPNVIADSLDISEIRTHEEFNKVEDQNLVKNTYYIIDSTIFFSPDDKGRRVKIEYLWQEEPPEETQTAKDPDEDEDFDGEGDLDPEDAKEVSSGEEKPEKEKGFNSPSKGEWTIDSAWFKWKPLEADVTVNNSLRVKLAKNLDLQQGFKVVDKATGKALRTKVTGLKNERPTNTPAPGEVAYSYSDGFLHFGSPEDSGKTFHVEYFIPGKNKEKLYLKDKTKEYELLEGIKGQSQSLWTAILDHPDPAFVSEHIIPLIETEVEHLREKDEEAAEGLPDSGDFIRFEHLLAKRESDDNEENRKIAKEFIETDLAPRLTKLYSLASLISERVYDMQSEEEPDEDFPEFIGSGSRSLDRKTLQYTKNVRQTANSLDHEVLDFSKYFTDYLSSLILEGSSYFQGKKVPFSTVKSTFEKAGVTIDELQSVALDAFRDAILAFDRNKRNSDILDPKDFRVMANPLIKRRVTNALSSFYQKYKKEQEIEETSRSGSVLVEIPKGGGVVNLISDQGDPVVGFRVDSLVVEGPSNQAFTSAEGREFVAQQSRRFKELAAINLGKRDFSSSAQVSVALKSGKKLKRIVGRWEDVKKEMEANPDPDSFYFSRSSGTVFLDLNYKDQKFIVEAPGVSSGASAGVIGKDQYKANPSQGTLEFSAANGGEVVTVRFDQKIRATRFVSPTSLGGEDEEDQLDPSDLIGAEGADPESMSEAIDKQEQLEKFLAVVSKVLQEENDPRLDRKMRAILVGVLGMGPEGKRLSEEEIGVRPPFSYNKEDGSLAANISTIKKKRKEAEGVLATILTEKAGDDGNIRRMLKPFSSILFGKGGQVVEDPFLSYLANPDTQPEKVVGFQRVLDSYLIKGQAGLTEDEEDILRWIWAIPGGSTEMPAGIAPATSAGERSTTVGERLQEIARDVFGMSVDENIDPEDLAVVREGYKTALDKFNTSFRKVFVQHRKVFQSKYYDFATFYDAQTGKKSLADELTAIDSSEALTPSNPKVKAPKLPLFDQIKKSFPKIPPDQLKSLMTEVADAGKAGGSIDSLISQRTEELNKVKEKGQKHIDKSTTALRKEIDELQKALTNTGKQLDALRKDRERLSRKKKEYQTQALQNMSPEDANELSGLERKRDLISELISGARNNSLGQIFTPIDLSKIEDPNKLEAAQERQDTLSEYSYLRDATGEDLTDQVNELSTDLDELKKQIKEVKDRATELSDAKVRKVLKLIDKKEEELAQNTSKFVEVQAKQKSVLSAKQKEAQDITAPFRKRLEEIVKGPEEEIQTLTKVQKYLLDREDLKRSDGTVDVENMFGQPKNVKGPGYVAPKLAPGEKDEYRPNQEKFKEKAKVEPSKTSVDPNLETFNQTAPKTEKPTASDLSPDELKDMKDKVKFAPTKEAPSSNTQRSLADELKAVALKHDPEETKKAWAKRLQNFDVLLRGLQKHFAAGESIVTFRPNYPATHTLSDQQAVIKSIAKYLLSNGDSIKKSHGVWDFSNMYKVSIDRPVEDLTVKPKNKDDEQVEALFNAQESLVTKDEAGTLHRLLQVVGQGKSISDIMKKFKASKASDATASLNVAQRLQVFQALHSDLKKDGVWDFSSLYDGTHKFPSLDEANATRPITDQMLPLIKSIQKQLLEDAKEKAAKDGTPVPGIESEASTQSRVLDMLERMSDLASKGKTLDEMAEAFLDTDKKSPRGYSLAHLFQVTRNYLNRLNRTVGLANMSDDLGLSKVFGEGAPAGSPSEQDEVKPEKVDSLPQRTTSFQTMVKSFGMDKLSQEMAYRILMKAQLAGAEGVPPAVTFTTILKDPRFKPVMTQILTYISKNQPEFNSGVPSFPDFSSLTGIPFNNPAEVEKPETIAPLPETLKSKPPVPTTEVRDKLRKTIFEDMVKAYELDDDQRKIFGDAVEILKMVPLHELEMKTEGTILENVPALIAQFWMESGLVNSKHQPDFRVVKTPRRNGRENFFNPDGSPNTKAVAKVEPDFNADEIAADMPEPSAVSDEEENAFSEALEEGKGKFSPELQKAKDFLTSDQVPPVSGKEEAQRPTAIARLQRNIWSMMAQEYSFDEDPEEEEIVLTFLREMKKRGVAAVLGSLKDAPLQLAEEIVSYMKNEGLSEDKIPGIVLPKPKKETPKVPAKSAPPTVRQKVGEEAVAKLLPFLKSYSQDKDFNVADFVRGLEGKIVPEAAKNLLLEAMEGGYISLSPGAYADADLNFLPVTEEGKALVSGKFLKMPLPKAAPASPASPKQAPSAPAAPALGMTPEATQAALKTLYNKALEYCSKHNMLSDMPFKILLKKSKPELLPLYEQVSAKVQEALDASNQSDDELDFEL